MTTISRTALSSPSTDGHRLLQLWCGVACMVAISSPQYVWTLFTSPLMKEFRVSLAEIQVTFSILIVLQTFLSPFQGFLVDKLGPRLLLGLGTALTGLSWVLAGLARNVLELYLSYGVLGGIGTGTVYVGVVGLVVQWFPERRGFASGLVAAGYGMGAILTTLPISGSLTGMGYRATLMVYGTVFGLAGLLISQALRRPPSALRGSGTGAGQRKSARPTQMLKSPVFWVMFGMMTLMSTSGLMVISQMGAFAKDFGVANVMVLGTAALPLALTLDRCTNGLTRPLFGWISDRIGRENTMFMAFALEALAMTAWLATRQSPVTFVLLSGIVFLGWGEIFSLFPATLTDTFGTEHATANYGCLYMAQGVGSVLGGPLAAMLHQASGSWTVVFQIMIAMDATAALAALLILKPMRRQAALREREWPLPAGGVAADL
ncbi:MAG TPA: oxalate/formate MFS antiporter [Chthoniobacterales bacterium]